MSDFKDQLAPIKECQQRDNLVQLINQAGKKIDAANSRNIVYTNSSHLPTRKKVWDPNLSVEAKTKPLRVDTLDNSFLTQKCENLTERNIDFVDSDLKGYHKRMSTADPISVIEMVTNGMYN
jgi:hypothetical protein